MKNKKLSIIIPAYNEENRIKEPLEKLCKYFTDKDLGIPTTEILVVVNNTTDNTIHILKDLQEKYPIIRYLDIPLKTHKGGAITIGFEKAEGNYVCFVDADGSSSPKEIHKLYNEISDPYNTDPKPDIIIGNRYDKLSSISGNMPLLRTIYSRLFNTLIVKGLFNLKYSDTQCGLKIFTQKTIKLLQDKVTCFDWLFDLNLLLIAKYLNLNVCTIPTEWTYKDDSTISFTNSCVRISKEIIQLKLSEIKLWGQKVINLIRLKVKIPYHLLMKRRYIWSNHTERNL
jgi:glycosyltransferase involved in cell wall biosynthesis